MYKELQLHVYDSLSKFAAVAFALLALFLLGNLFIAALHNVAFEGQILTQLFRSDLLRLIFVGLAFAFLASVIAWPFALATAVVLSQDSLQLWTRFAVRFFRGLAYLPSIVYGFVFCWALGPAFQSKLKGAWVGLFSADHAITELLAFAVTLLGYPLTIFTSASEGLTINMFYGVIKLGIVELADDGFSAFVIIASLSFFLIPLFVVTLHRILMKAQNNQYILAARALGATDWESLHITMTHVMRPHFIGLFLFGVGRAFVEGVSVFIVLNFFFLSGDWDTNFWGETLSSYLVKSLFFHQLSWYDYSVLVSALLFVHLGISYLRRSFFVSDREDLTI